MSSPSVQHVTPLGQRKRQNGFLKASQVPTNHAAGKKHLIHLVSYVLAVSALTLLVGRQEGHPAWFTFLVPAHLGSPGKRAVNTHTHTHTPV